MDSDPGFFVEPDGNDSVWNLASCLFKTRHLTSQMAMYSSFGKIGKPVPFSARLSLMKRRDVPDRIAAAKKFQ